MLKSRIQDKQVFALWLSPECRSFTKARRGKRTGLSKKGFPGPLRSHGCLLGLPGLSIKDQQKVRPSRETTRTCLKGKSSLPFQVEHGNNSTNACIELRTLNPKPLNPFLSLQTLNPGVWDRLFSDVQRRGHHEIQMGSGLGFRGFRG